MPRPGTRCLLHAVPVACRSCACRAFLVDMPLGCSSRIDRVPHASSERKSGAARAPLGTHQTSCVRMAPPNGKARMPCAKCWSLDQRWTSWHNENLVQNDSSKRFCSTKNRHVEQFHRQEGFVSICGLDGLLPRCGFEGCCLRSLEKHPFAISDRESVRWEAVHQTWSDRISRLVAYDAHT